MMDDIAEVVGSALGVRPAKPAAPATPASEAALRGQVQLTPAEAAKSAAFERSPDNLAELRGAIAAEKDPKNRQILQAELQKQSGDAASDDIGAVVGSVLGGQSSAATAAAPAKPATSQESADIGRIVAARGAPSEKPSVLESIGAGAGKAAGSGVMAVQQLAGKGVETAGELTGMDWLTKAGKWLSEDAKQGAKKLEAENAPYEAANPKSNIAGQVTGMVLSPLNKLVPGMGTGGGLGVTVLRGGAQGAILNTLTAPVTSDGSFLTEKAKQAAVGAVGGTLGATLGHGLSKAINASITGARNTLGRAASGQGVERIADGAVDEALRATGITRDQITPELFDGLRAQALEAVNSGRGVIDEAAMRRLVSSQTLPVPVPLLQGNITRDAMQFAKEQNLRGIRGVGEPIVAVMQARNRALIGNLDALGANRGADVVQAGRAAIDTVARADAAADDAVAAAYRAFRESTGRELEVPLHGLAQDYARILEERGPNIPAAVRARFEGMGLLDGTQRRLGTITEMEGLIKNYINKNFDPANRPVAGALSELRRAVQRAIEEGAGEGASGEAAALARAARAAARARFQEIDATPAYRAVVDGVEPDKFIQRFILQGNEGEIRSLMSVINRQSPAEARSLADAVMAHIKERVLNKASPEDGAISLDKLKGFTRDPNMRARLAQVLGPERMATLRQLTDVTEDALHAPVGSAVNTSNTASAAANLVNEAVSGGALNKALGVAKMVPVLSRPAEIAQGAVRSNRAADLVAEAVTPSVARQAGRSTAVDLTGLGALGGASYFGTKSRSRRQQ